MGTKIDYVDETLNFISGCTKISPGCTNCYAEIMTNRLKEMGQEKYQSGFDKVVEHWSLLTKRLRKKETRYMINSMSDTFHPDVSFSFLYKLFEKFIFYPWNTFIIVTKRAERASLMIKDIWFHLSRNHPKLKFPLKNVWLVVTTENQEMFNERIYYLMNTPVSIRGLSIEPMLSSINISKHVENLDWVIVGGESGSKGRPMHEDWPLLIRKQCQTASTAFWFKKWGEWQMGSAHQTKAKHAIILNDGRYVDYKKGPCGFEEMTETEWEKLNPNVIAKVGKKKSGNVLCEKIYSELPCTKR